MPNQPNADREIFAGAMECATPEERAAYLASACGGDAELRARVEALLQAYEQAGRFLDEGDQRATALTEPVREGPGTRIGRYKLLQQIGEGGMGIVYMAEQREPMVRKVALKIIKAGMDTRQVVARFEAERQALALMDHPNIAKVLDGGMTESGRPYFVMDLVQGLPITQFCDEARLSTGERLDLFLDVCSAIQHAHQKGIIHRDIKPSNILVTLHGDKAVPKVIDFGIAKATQQRLTDKTLFTLFQNFIGTPAYMSPEQASLSGLDIDTRSDIYALGVLLYELLTGKTPFDGKELLKAGLDEMRRTIKEKEPLRPSTRLSTLQGEDAISTAKRHGTDASKLVTLVRGDLDWIAMKCLEKDRTRRYETASALAMDIQRHLQNEPVGARPPSNVYRFQKLVHRNKLAFAAAAAVMFALLIGLVTSTWLLAKERAARRRAVAAEMKAESEAARSTQVAQFMKEMLKGVGPRVAMGRDTTLLREIVDQTVQQLEKDLKDHPEVEAQLRATLGHVYYDLGQYTNAAAMHGKAVELRKRLLGAEHLDTATSLNDLGETLSRQGRQREGEPLIREALAIRKKRLGNEHLDVASSLDSLGMLIRPDTEPQTRAAEGEACVREALEMRRTLLGNEHLLVATSLEHLGTVLSNGRKFADAEQVHREALALRRKLLRGKHPDIATSLHKVAWDLTRQGKLAEAEALFHETVAMKRELLGNEHPELASALLNLGTTLERRRNYAGAAEAFREGLSINTRRLGNDSPTLVSGLNALAEILWHQGELSQAEALYRRALQIDTESYGNWHPDAGSIRLRLAGVLRQQGKLAEAETLFRNEIALVRNQSTKDSARETAELAWALQRLAEVRRQRKDLTEALSLAEEATGIYRRHPDWPWRDRQSALEVLRDVLMEIGDLSALEVALREELQILRTRLAPNPQLDAPIRWLATTLLRENKFAEAEPLARETLAIRESVAPDEYHTFEACSLLGGALLGQKQYADAEALLLSGYEGLKKREDEIPKNRKSRLTEAIQRLVQIYEATDRPDQAAEWKKKLAALGKGREIVPERDVAE